MEEGQSVEKKHAPAPDHPRKPDDPTDLHKPSWKYIVKKTFREFTSDQCIDIAASLTYFAVLALFPAIIALLSLLGLFGQSEQAVDSLLEIVGSVAPANVIDLLEEPLRSFSSSPAAGFAFFSGLLVAIWSASGYVGAFTRAMNRIYEVDEGRPFLKLKPIQVLVTVISLVLIVIMAIILVVSGPIAEAVGDLIGLGAVATTVWSIVKWPILAFAAVLVVAILFYATPNVKQPKFRWMSLGAFIALLTMLVASLAFGFYVANFSNYDRTYGSLAGVVIFLLWLWISNMALLFGAEFDAEMERGRQLQAGIAAERDIQLPPRDTKKSEKQREKEAQDILAGRRIRLQAESSRASEKDDPDHDGEDQKTAAHQADTSR